MSEIIVVGNEERILWCSINIGIDECWYDVDKYDVYFYFEIQIWNTVRLREFVFENLVGLSRDCRVLVARDGLDWELDWEIILQTPNTETHSFLNTQHKHLTILYQVSERETIWLTFKPYVK